MHGQCHWKTNCGGSMALERMRPPRQVRRRKGRSPLQGILGTGAAQGDKIIILEEHRMNRLPKGDSTSSLLERAAFLALNAGAVALISIALLDGARFAAGREQIGQALSAKVQSSSFEPASIAQPSAPIGLNATPQTAGAPRLRQPKS
jgi:hypothetical protein